MNTRKAMFVVPEAPAQSAVVRTEKRTLAGQGGIRLGVLDNCKGNADHLLAMMIDRMKAALTIASVVMVRKPTAVQAAPKALLDQLEREADCVISAMAD